MNWYGGGLIAILTYGAFSEAVQQNDTIITENGFDLLTESSQEILTET